MTHAKTAENSLLYRGSSLRKVLLFNCKRAGGVATFAVMCCTHLAGAGLARPGHLLVPLPSFSLGSVSLPLPLPPVLLPLPLPRLQPPSSPAEPPLLLFPLSPLPMAWNLIVQAEDSSLTCTTTPVSITATGNGTLTVPLAPPPGTHTWTFKCSRIGPYSFPGRQGHQCRMKAPSKWFFRVEAVRISKGTHAM